MAGTWFREKTRFYEIKYPPCKSLKIQKLDKHVFIHNDRRFFEIWIIAINIL